MPASTDRPPMLAAERRSLYLEARREAMTVLEEGLAHPATRGDGVFFTLERLALAGRVREAHAEALLRVSMDRLEDAAWSREIYGPASAPREPQKVDEDARSLASPQLSAVLEETDIRLLDQALRGAP